MKTITKRFLALFVMLAVVCGMYMPSYAAPIGSTSITSAGACVLDYESGEVLYEYNGYVPRVPASMTKIMNMYCVYDALAAGEITLDTVVPISANVYAKSRDPIYQSVLPLYYNTTYTVDEMIDVIVTYSASGAAVAMAELVGGGSEAAFVDRMNKKAAELGLDAWYYDSCGIADNQITPVSMAKLAAAIIREYPDILTRSSKRSVSFHGGTYRSTNHLFDTYYYEGADGLKTGTTPAAGYCFCGTAVRNGRRIISVTMSSSSGSQRFIDTARLLDYGFAAARDRFDTLYYTDIKVFVDGSEIPAFVNLGDSRTVIRAEELSCYGFTVSYDAQNRIVYISRAPEQLPSPAAMDDYRGRSGEKAFDITPGSDIRVILTDGDTTYEFGDVYDLNGYTAVSADEFGKIYDVTWDQNAASLYIDTSSVTAVQSAAAPTAAPTEQPGAVLPNGSRITSESAFVMDFETGDELYSVDPDTQRPVASIAKMMSVYVLLDAVKNGELSLDQTVPISENAYELSRVEDYKMMVNLEYDETYTLDEMIDMIVIDSAAACVTACAELLCGSEDKFVERMNEKARELGIDSVFYNGTGVCLDPAADKENLMSAREVAVMTRHMISDYPEILERTSRSSVEFHGDTYYNLNKLFTDYRYEGADGFKNGMTEASGYCMCATAERGGKRVIAVTLPSDSNTSRFTDSIALMDLGFELLGVDNSAYAEPESSAPTADMMFTDESKIRINIDGNYEMTFPDQQPVIIDGYTMVPIRALMETLEKTVTWDDASRTVSISDETTELVLTENSGTMIKRVTDPLSQTVTSSEIQLDKAPALINGRICLPLRAVCEEFGMAVIWDADTETVLIIAGVC